MHPIYRARPSFCANLNLLAHDATPPADQIVDSSHSSGIHSPSSPSRPAGFPYLLDVPDHVYVPVDSGDSASPDAIAHSKKYHSVPLSVHYRMYYRKIIPTEYYGAETNYSHHPNANDDVDDTYDNSSMSTPVCLEPRSQDQTLDNCDDTDSSSTRHSTTLSSAPPSPGMSSGTDSLTLSICSEGPRTPESPHLLSPYPSSAFSTSPFCAPAIRSFF